MYNDRRYSLARFSVNPGERTAEISERFSASLEAVAGAAVPVSFQERYAETCRGSVRGTISVLTALAASGDLFALAEMSADVVTGAVLSEALGASAYGQKDTPAVLTAPDALAALARGSKDVPTALDLADRLAAAAAGSKDVPATLPASEVLTSLLEATSQTTERAVFSLAIPPGGELRIDSELFLVLLNGENVLHTQSGDWVSVSRSLLRLTVESASGGALQGQLIYTERYL